MLEGEWNPSASALTTTTTTTTSITVSYFTFHKSMIIREVSNVPFKMKMAVFWVAAPCRLVCRWY
jgi:hypothetical protein